MSMSIEKALDMIADVLTKTTDDSNGSIEYSLTAIANALANGGAKELPTVTATDNGDVLTVVEGAWAKAQPLGGGDFVKITAEYVDEQLTLDKTYAEIAEIIEGGGIPFVYGGTSVYMLTGYDTSSGFAKFGSAIYYGTGTTAYVDEIYVNGDGATATFMSLTVSASGE